MKTILCYGDSNTWGWDPVSQARLARDVRWPGVLRAQLGLAYEVIEEGLNGRTTVWDDPIDPYKSGKNYLIPCLESHRPVDLVILMLGTNDLKTRFSVSAYDIAAGVETLVNIIKLSGSGPAQNRPEILLLSPAPLGLSTDLSESFAQSRPKSLQLAAYLQTIADEQSCSFMDAGQIVTTSTQDGAHLEASEHQKLGVAVADRVRELFPTREHYRAQQAVPGLVSHPIAPARWAALKGQIHILGEVHFTFVGEILYS